MTAQMCFNEPFWLMTFYYSSRSNHLFIFSAVAFDIMDACFRALVIKEMVTSRVSITWYAITWTVLTGDHSGGEEEVASGFIAFGSEKKEKRKWCIQEHSRVV